MRLVAAGVAVGSLSKDLATLGCAEDWAIGVIFHRDSRAMVSVSSIEVVVMDSLCLLRVVVVKSAGVGRARAPLVDST